MKIVAMALLGFWLGMIFETTRYDRITCETTASVAETEFKWGWSSGCMLKMPSGQWVSIKRFNYGSVWDERQAIADLKKRYGYR